jgi:hypothetical protein
MTRRFPSLPDLFPSLAYQELIITAGGENVHCSVENTQGSYALSNAMVVGDKRKFLAVLFCLQVEIDDESSHEQAHWSRPQAAKSWQLCDDV